MPPRRQYPWGDQAASTATSDANLAELVCHHACLCKTWRDSIDGNASWSKFLRQSFRVLFQRAFAAKIGCRTGKTQMGSIGRNVHDAATPFEHVGRFLHREAGALGVQGDDLIEVSLGCLQEGLRHKPPGIVDENVEPAELLHRFDHEAARVGHLAHVRLDGDGIPTLVLNASDYLLSFLRTRSVIYHHDRSVFGQSLRDRSADSIGSPSHNSHFSTQRPHLLVSFMTRLLQGVSPLPRKCPL